MTRYVIKRVLRGVLTVFGVMVVSFFLLRLTGNPTRLLLSQSATQAQVDALSHQLGYDRPLIAQFGSFLVNAVQGNLGDSLVRHTSAFDLVIQRVPATFELAVAAFLIGIVPAFVAAVLVQITGWRWLRTTLLWLGSIRQAIPVFVFGILLVLVFSIGLHLLPSQGNLKPTALILPAVTMGTFELALYLRLFSSSLQRENSADYVRTARSKGKGPIAIVLSDTLSNAVLPVLAVAGLNFGALLGGAAVVEVVFNWPGVGQLMLTSVSGRDFPVVQAGLLVISVIFVVVNLLIDLLHGVLDPRVRLS
ncbi:ABC transporter permease [Frondihabitans cladoniiphilus]|uniref:ABC transporter permease n=1 Tax=Frondihabitans cladoniiphilus TaxID=715785 RepID=A0ABP8W488_9MICO